MGAPALKVIQETPENTREFPIFALMTKVLIQSLCPLLKSEILFGNIEQADAGESFPFWIDANVTGDLKGKFGIGTDKHTLKTLALHLKVKERAGTTKENETIAIIHESLATELDKQCMLEDFHCEMAKGSGILTDYHFAPPDEAYYFCPIETKYGVIKAYFSLTPSSAELHDDLMRAHSFYEPRKIRVYASQLDALYKSIKGLENYEKQLLNGPQVRSQMRSQIKKVKRMLHQLKSESLDTLFLPARKLVVDISKVQGKQIKFSTHGTWLCLDKTLLNFLYEPILHLIRNAVDHGIEEPAERERIGKPSTGNIRCLAAFNEKGLRIILSDDGRGLDLPKVREIAVAKGILSQDVANRATSDQLADLIFKAGFSTREKADSISGRGLGLDIVRKGVESVGGYIKILNTSNHGTSFEICIPLSEDFQTNLLPKSSVDSTQSKEEEERQLLLDELAGYFDRMNQTLLALKNEKSVRAAYGLYRLAHSVKGAAGFLGWNRVAGFCHHYEELLKLASEEKVSLDDELATVIYESGTHLKDFCEASKTDANYPLIKIRRLEARILQAIWSATKSDERTHLFFGKYHLTAVEKCLAPLAKGKSFTAQPESDFGKAIKQPYGALVQFSGDRKGYAGILLPEETFTKVVHPMITGAKEKGKVKQQLWSLGEFANLMGQAITELSHKAQINLNTSAPLTYYGWGQPLRILGNPTYCYSCDIEGAKFYLAGDFRMPQEMVESGYLLETASVDPRTVMREATTQCQKHFSSFGLKIAWNEQPTQSDLIGFDGGITAIISCVSPEPGGADHVLFLSYEASLAQHIQKTFGDNEGGNNQIDVYDCLNENSNIVGGLLVAELEKRKMPLKLSLPTVFIGKAYVANFNRLYVTNKLVGVTPKGKFELQILVTQLAG